jgi:hypothetical protein
MGDAEICIGVQIVIYELKTVFPGDEAGRGVFPCVEGDAIQINLITLLMKAQQQTGDGNLHQPVKFRLQRVFRMNEKQEKVLSVHLYHGLPGIVFIFTRFVGYGEVCAVLKAPGEDAHENPMVPCTSVFAVFRCG